MRTPEEYRILVVDDEELLRELVAEILADAKFQVIKAPSGNAALEIFKTQKIDLVISDMRMPNGDGMFLLSEIRKLNEEVPLLFISGFSDHSLEECLRRGAIGIIQKPFTSEGLLRNVNEAFVSPARADLCAS